MTASVKIRDCREKRERIMAPWPTVEKRRPPVETVVQVRIWIQGVRTLHSSRKKILFVNRSTFASSRKKVDVCGKKNCGLEACDEEGKRRREQPKWLL